jgi:hypothetical protein
MAQGGPIRPTHPDSWIEPGERVLWHGQPLVDRRFQNQLWVRAAVLVLAPIILDLLWFHTETVIPLVATGVIAAWALFYIPYYRTKLIRTEYFLTSRRAVVVVNAGEAQSRITWAALGPQKIKFKTKPNGSGFLDWGQSVGRTAYKDGPVIQIARALGFLDRANRERVTFVQVSQPATLMSAIVGARSALGLPPDIG